MLQIYFISIISLLYLVIVACLACYILFLVIRGATNKAERAARLWAIAFYLLPFLLLTWPITLGRVVFEFQCAMYGGLHKIENINGTDGGYFLEDSYSNEKNGRHVSSHPYAHQAVYDLITGKIKFFEGYGSYSGGKPQKPYVKVSLSDEKSIDCITREQHEELLSGLKLPLGKCLIYEHNAFQDSGYVVSGYEKNPKWGSQTVLNDVSVKKVPTKEVVARYKTINLSGKFLNIILYNSILMAARVFGLQMGEILWRGIHFISPNGLQCPAGDKIEYSPLRAITATVFADAHGRTMSQTDFKSLDMRTEKFYPQEFPPRQDDAYQMAKKTDTCEFPERMSAAFLQRVFVYKGGGIAHGIRISSSSVMPRQVDVVVNSKDKSIFLHLLSNEPVIWNIRRTSETNLIGVISMGVQGSAVIGVDRSIPVAISSRYFSTLDNCNSAELSKIFQHIVREEVSEIRMHDPGMILIGEKPSLAEFAIESSIRNIDDYFKYIQ